MTLCPGGKIGSETEMSTRDFSIKLLTSQGQECIQMCIESVEGSYLPPEHSLFETGRAMIHIRSRRPSKSYSPLFLCDILSLPSSVAQ